MKVKSVVERSGMLGCEGALRMMGRGFLLSLAFGSFAAEATIRAVIPCVPEAERTRQRWEQRLTEKQALVEKGGAPFVFIGDSITCGFETGAGREVWAKYFGGKDAPFPAINLGFGGDCTEQVLYRIAHGELDGYEAKAVVLMIGTNNTGHRDETEEPPVDTVLGVKACVDAIRARQPKAKIVLCSIFPRGATAQDEARRRNDVVNRELRKFADGRHVFWCDLSHRLMRTDGTLPTELFPDLLHPSELGYEIWASAVIPYFDGLAASTFPAEVLAGEMPSEGPAALNERSRIPADWWVRKISRNRNRISECGGSFDIVMLGDSITHYWEIGEGLDDSHDIEILEKKYSILNCGYGGDRIENLLWRVRHGELDGYAARLVTLMIGTNNSGDRPEDIIRGVRTVLEEVRRKQPTAKVLLMGYLPCGERKDDVRRAKLDAVRPCIRLLADGKDVLWFDCSERFLKPDGSADKAMFDYEYIHPSTEGYRVWREELEPVLKQILGK